MTPEEQRRMQMQIQAILAQQGQQPPPGGGMSTPMSATGGYDPAMEAAKAKMNVNTGGLKGKLAVQQQMANELRGRKMPEGRTVGPSNIYVAPNWAESLAAAGERLGGAYMSGKLGEQYDKLGALEATQREGQLEYEDAIRRDEQQFKGEESALSRAVQRELGQLSADTSRYGTDVGADVAREGQLSAQQIAAKRLEADAAAAAQATLERREEGTKSAPYMLDGKVVQIATDATGKNYLGDVTGTPIDSETMARAINYKPGTDSGTIGDAGAFQMPVEEQGQATPNFMGNLLTSDYFDAATGVFDPERWAGQFAIGPDGKMVQATQSQMATTTLGAMAQRMEEINLRPWTEKEIETISADFPDANSEYPDWANFTLNIAIPRLNARFAEAKIAGRTDDATQNKVMNALYADVIEGARKNGMPMSDLVQLGMNPDVIKKYLGGLQ